MRECAGESSSDATRDGELAVDMIAMSAEVEGQSLRRMVSERGIFVRRKGEEDARLCARQ